MNLLLALLLAAGSFSHKTHAPLKLSCLRCHAGAEKEEQAGLPSISDCKVCHTTMAEAKFTIKRLPDFVFFSHAQHKEAEIACSVCHTDAWQQESKVSKPLRMKECVDCHKEHKAATGCNVCHELGQ